jgi:hypothetical protein
MHLAVTHVRITVAPQSSIRAERLEDPMPFRNAAQPADPGGIRSQAQARRVFHSPFHNFGEKFEKIHQFYPNLLMLNYLIN